MNNVHILVQKPDFQRPKPRLTRPSYGISLGACGNKWRPRELVFTGTYQRTIDTKRRLLLPTMVRNSFTVDSIFLTPGTDNCLEVHSESSLNRLAESINQAKGDSKNQKTFRRLFYAQAELCKIDALGRIRIPKRLAEIAEVEKEVIVVGVGFNWEIWDERNWNLFVSDSQPKFDMIHQSTFDSFTKTTGDSHPTAVSPKPK